MATSERAGPSDTVWLITGCSSGIGAALATCVHEAGHFLVATSRDPSRLAFLPDSRRILRIQLDVTSPSAVSSTVAAAVQSFGRIDVLVNNAGYGLFGVAEGIEAAEARAQFETNFWAPVNLTKEVVRTFREVNNPSGRGGTVVQISSFGGWIGFPGGSFYYASKFALEGFTEALAKEMHPEWNIDFVMIEPGGVKTEFAGSSIHLGAVHPAYKDPGCPSNRISGLLSNQQLMDEAWSDPADVGQAIFQVVASRGSRRLPLRLPLGKDALRLIREDVRAFEKELGAWEQLIGSTTSSQQEETQGFKDWMVTLSSLVTIPE